VHDAHYTPTLRAYLRIYVYVKTSAYRIYERRYTRVAAYYTQRIQPLKDIHTLYAKKLTHISYHVPMSHLQRIFQSPPSAPFSHTITTVGYHTITIPPGD